MCFAHSKFKLSIDKINRKLKKNNNLFFPFVLSIFHDQKTLSFFDLILWSNEKQQNIEVNRNDENNRNSHISNEISFAKIHKNNIELTSVVCTINVTVPQLFSHRWRRCAIPFNSYVLVFCFYIYSVLGIRNLIVCDCAYFQNEMMKMI